MSGERHWFEDVADHLGPAYLRYSFTMGTAQEVAFLTEVLGLEAGMTVLDVGCGPGRHAVALAKAGIGVIAVDISERFLEVGEDVAVREGVSDLIEWHRIDARRMADDARVAGRGVDAAISLCQGAFGLGGPTRRSTTPRTWHPTPRCWQGSAPRCVPADASRSPRSRRTSRCVGSRTQDSFDAQGAVNHETTELRDTDGLRADAELWTTCYTPRELRLLAERCGAGGRPHLVGDTGGVPAHPTPAHRHPRVPPRSPHRPA